MRRCSFFVVLLLVLGLLSITGGAQVEGIPGLILTDLQLISQESLPHWTPAWTGPVQGATIAAWFAEHGYPALMRDFNGDGIVDELDTIELANNFGLGRMQTETPRGTTDVRLVVGLATYIAETYPNEFVLKIYDLGFPAEFSAQGYGTFAPDVIPNILLELKEEPSIEAYVHELSTGEGVIVGLEENTVDRNRYLSGRSFLYEPTPEGFKPLDFAWANEDRWEPGHQGQVLETVGVMEDRFYIEFQGNWVPVEFMLALSPIIEHEVETEEHGCPEDAIAYDVTTTMLGRYGSVRIEECVLREGDADIYFWTVTNIDFVKDGCGICFFRIPNPGLAEISHGETAPWIFTSAWGSWIWWLPMGGCGLQPGQSAVFMIVVPGPTTDTWVNASIGQCQPPIGTVAQLFSAQTTGPGLPDDGCPDLVIRILDESCVYDTRAQEYELTVWGEVENIGTEPVTSLFDVRLASTSHPGNDTTTVLPPVLPGGTVPVTLSFTVPPEPTGGAPCPMTYELRVDSGSVIDECNELNNLAIGDICCESGSIGACCLPDGSCVSLTAAECDARGGTQFHPGVDCSVVQCPQTQGDCPDLTVEVRSVDCELDRKNGIYELTVSALVTNIGTQTVTDPIWVQAECDRGDDSSVIHTDLDPGDTATVEFEITFSVNEPGCPLPVTVEVDYLDFIDECDEFNNTDSGSACCD